MKPFGTINKWAVLAPIFSFFVLWGIWYFRYFYVMYWMEGFSFFSTLPDFTSIQMSFPADVFKYIGAYLLQFFRAPIYGAAIQAGITVFIVICLELCMIRIFKSSRTIWLAFVPIPIFVGGQYEDITLERSMQWCVIVLAITVALYVFKFRKMTLTAPDWLQATVLLWGVPSFALCLSAYSLMDKNNEYQLNLCKIDYYANKKEWERVLQLIPPQEARKDELKLRYALLALSETGKLADCVFAYGIKDYSQFLCYGSEDPFDRNFNALFFQALSVPNEVIHQNYQQSLTSPFGFNFRSLRMLIDTYLELGNQKLASKYIEVLRHSSFHKEWIENRLHKLNDMKLEERANNKEFSPFVGNFLETITSLVNQNPDNKKNIDLYLCAVLTTRNADFFYQAFQIAAQGLYDGGRCIPRYYEEALLLLALQNKDILTRYNISKESKQRFVDFMKIYQRENPNKAKAKYNDSYWSFVL